MSHSSNFGTFQISTDQLSDARPIDRQPEPSRPESQIPNVIATKQNATQVRASQLSDFVQSLAVNNRPTRQSPDAATANTTFRFDEPITAQGTVAQQPHFETQNYIPSNEDIQKTIQQLKADGRILADDVQWEADRPAEQALRPRFQWPEVTDTLLASGAMTNLAHYIEGYSFGGYTDPTNKPLVVSASHKGAGSTTIAISLARQFAIDGYRVLLIDANLNNAVLAARLGIHDHNSWLYAISQRHQIDDIVVSDSGHSMVDLLPLQSMTAVNWERKLLTQLRESLLTLGDNYDRIILDAGSVDQMIQETRLTASGADQLTLLVTDSNQSATQSEQAKLLLQRSRINNVIVVENFATASTAIKSKVG